MNMELSYLEIVALAICMIVGWGVRYYSVPIHSLIEKEEYLYLGRVFLWVKKDFYAINIPHWFIDQSITTKFVVALPKHCIKKNKYAEMTVKTKWKKQVIHIQDEAVFFL